MDEFEMLTSETAETVPEEDVYGIKANDIAAEDLGEDYAVESSEEPHGEFGHDDEIRTVVNEEVVGETAESLADDLNAELNMEVDATNLTAYQRRKRQDDVEDAISKQQAELARASALHAAVRQKKVVKVRIAGVQVLENKDAAMPCAVGLVISDIGAKDVAVLIPYTEFFDPDPIDPASVDTTTERGRDILRTRRRQILSKVIGGEMPVMLMAQSVIDGRPSIVGSRRAAMDLIRKRAFSGNSAYYHEGDVCKGQVINASPHAVVIAFGGFDIVIRHFELTMRYTMDCSAAYHVGDMVEFLLQRIKRNDAGEAIGVEIDTKAREIENCRERMEMIAPGTIVRATISTIHKGQRGGNDVRIIAWIHDYECPIIISYANLNYLGRDLIAGQECQVMVGPRRTKAGLLTGNIRYLSGTYGLYNAL